MTNYKILINSKGVPVLIEVPEKPICECEEIDGAGDFDDTHDRCEKRFIAYEQALSTALADESKWIAFKDEQYVRYLLYGDEVKKSGDQIEAMDIVNKVGQTFDLPENIGVSFEHKCFVCEAFAGERCKNQEGCDAEPDMKVAILTPKPVKEPTCGDCGQELTLVRPGKHQCDNPNCIQNNSKPENSAHSFTEGMEVPESVPSCGEPEKEDTRRWPAIRLEEKIREWRDKYKYTVIDGKSEFSFACRKTLEWIHEEYDITPKAPRQA